MLCLGLYYDYCHQLTIHSKMFQYSPVDHVHDVYDAQAHRCTHRDSPDFFLVYVLFSNSSCEYILRYFYNIASHFSGVWEAGGLEGVVSKTGK